MSSESSSDESPQALSLEIPELSSADSSLAPSPTGILSPSSSHASLTTSLNGKLNVKFAPLPELVPRKRRHMAPMGVAARSQMVWRRRQLRGEHVNAYYSNPMWTAEELERHQELAMQEGQRRHNQHHLVDEEEDAEDPLLALGRMMKDAGKTLLRKVSIKDLSRKIKKEKDSAGEKDIGAAFGEKEDKHETVADEAPTSQEDQQRPTLKPRTPNGESEKDDDERFQTIGQTETIREGDAKYIRISEDLADNTTGRTPTQSNYTSH